MELTAAPHQANFYDQVPYPSLSFGVTHPDHVGTVATLLGMTPPPIERCRILELGCASGGNIIPMAHTMPRSQFLGVDLSRREIADGQQMVDELGLTNIELRHADILDITPEWGQFDYIIAHGVFSWVPPKVQDHILAICRDNLSPDGIAYVSYNTFPGWHMIRMVRDMMLYHTRGIADPLQRASQARAIVGFYSEALKDSESAYSAFLHRYNEIVDEKLDSVDGGTYASVLHDELEEINEPLHFHQFAARLEQYDLQYMADADFTVSTGNRIKDEVRETLLKMAGDRVELEQYSDFLACRSFRRSLLCHRTVQLTERLRPQHVQGLYAVSPAHAVSADADLYSLSVVKFEGADKAAITTNHPVSKIALAHLGSIFPRGLSFGELLAEARARLAAYKAQAGEAASEIKLEEEEVDAENLAANLLSSFGYSHFLMELHMYAQPLVVEPGPHPIASPVARSLLRQGMTWVTNLRHERVQLDEYARFLVRHLDGTLDRGQLLDLIMAGPIADGTLVAKHDGQPVENRAEARRITANSLEDRLCWLGRAALLAG